ncbi:DUF4124 domain-containing protein [Rhodanobacter ginsengisoli]|uniref:DUF4124 domain-containing protein n=1 Tax=Rhodanobacter ginsengisoli TaxID=418646 RepID=A0ABW0QIS2_9GAMM
MRRPIILLCLVLLVRAVPAMAQAAIHHCIGANGGAVFTDQPCAALQATPVDSAARPNAEAPSAAPPPILCAASLGQLRQGVINAFAGRDANRMAGLMLWDGYGRGDVVADIRSLTQLMKTPLLDVDIPGEPADSDNDSPAQPGAGDDGAPFGADAPPDQPPRHDQLVLHMAGNDGGESPREQRFDVVRSAGCLWLRSAD